MAKCAAEGCPRAAKKRGLCTACYMSLWRLVAAGRASWDDLVARRIARGVRRTAAYRQALRHASERKARGRRRG